jgi:epidermal growth factor receptor substrate 15
MVQLEGALENSKQQLAEKENALEQAQKALAASEAKLVDQENALLSAHKQELQEANEQALHNKSNGVVSQIETLPIPDKPAVWFDLLPYLQSQPNMESLPVALTALMNDLESSINATEAALHNNSKAEVLESCKQLISLSDKINSDALGYLMASIQNDCTSGMVDNVSIRWPATKKGLQKTLRVVYSHLHA